MVRTDVGSFASDHDRPAQRALRRQRRLARVAPQLVLADAPIAVFPDRPNVFNPIHEDDIIRMMPGLFAAASVPATIVNWAATNRVDRGMVRLSRVARGEDRDFDETTETIESVTVDNTNVATHRRRWTVAWQEGLRRMVQARHADVAV